MSDTAEKKIYFYKIFMKKGNNSVNCDQVFSKIGSLPFTNEGRYFELKNENCHSTYVDSIASTLRANIGVIRRKDLPMKEQNGVTSLLDLPIDVGLYEPTHFVIFPNNVLGTEYNYYGPRISCLKDYITHKVPDLVDEVELIPLMKHDFMEQLSKIGEIKLFRLKVHVDNIVLTGLLNKSLQSALENMRTISGDADYIEVVLNSRYDIQLSFLDKLAYWLRRSEVKDNVSILQLRARNEETMKIETFDLLQEYMLSVKQVIKRDKIHRSVDKNSMYNAIEESYEELRPEILSIIGNGK